MNTILTIYGINAFKRYLLPAAMDVDHTIYLSKNLYGLETNIALSLEAIGGGWRFVPADEYDIVDSDDRSIFPRDVELDGLLASGNGVLQLIVNYAQVASIIIRKTDKYFSVYDHYRLPAAGETICIGRDRLSDIALFKMNSGLISGTHAKLIRSGYAWEVLDAGSTNGTFVNNRKIVGSVRLAFGDCIDLFGLRIVYLGSEIAINVLESGATVNEKRLRHIVPSSTSLTKVNDKDLEQVFHRAPRQLASLDTDPVKIDDAPPPKHDTRTATILGAIGSSIAMALPMLLGCAFMIYASNAMGVDRGAFMFVGVVTAVASAIIGVVRSIVGIRQARREHREYEELRNRRYGQYLHEREQVIRTKYEKNTAILRGRYQSAEEVSGYTTNDPMLWGKNASQEDFISHRLGVGEMPFQVKIEVPTRRFTLTDNALAELPDQIKAEYQTLHDVPLCVDLLQERLVGVIGGQGMVGAIDVVRCLVAQIAACNSYTDVKLVFVYDEERGVVGDTFGYAHWLPHVWNESRSFRYVATNQEESSDVFFELNRIVRERLEDGNHVGTRASIPKPYYILVLATPELLENELVAKYVLSPTPTMGLTTVYLAERYEDLPNECEYIVQNDSMFQGCYHATDNLDERTHITFDSLAQSKAIEQAESLANVRVIEPQSGGDVPESVTFFQMHNIHKPEDLNVMSRWRKNRTYESMKALIGQRSGGLSCYLDLHEKYHGPHGLVAGTTGSGKSETLQTLILSLAIDFSPDDVSFFIIDYKGGGMAELFSGLPHLVGQISNLSGNQVNRALISIQSEKNRREAVFKEYGVKDIRDYTKLVKSGEAQLPVPHLIIVIDEFAELKNDEPEFIQEVVSVSRVGRSLGIHLIMATQRPAGAVSEDIWANSRFKLCLRVQSRQDSNDMLHRPDAAYLTQSGRCYLQVGNDELFELFQSGYSGAIYSGDERDTKEAVATMLTGNGTPTLVGSHTRIQRKRKRKLAWITQLLDCVRECGINDSNVLKSYPYERLEEIANYLYQRLEAHGIDYPRSEFNSEALVMFLAQVGRCGFAADELVAVDDDPSNRIRLPQQPERTQLDAIVSHLVQVARNNKYNRDYRLFLPLLPKRIAVPELPQNSLPWDIQTVFNGSNWALLSGEPTLRVGLGIYDDPLNQRQDTYSLDLLQDGNIAVIGGPQSGKSTFLQTFVHNLTMRYTPAEVNLYLVEYSARKFSPFEEMPHVGGIVRDGDDTDRLDKLFNLTSGIVANRKRELGDISFGDYLRSHGRGTMPAMIIVIDNYASLLQRTGDSYSLYLRNLTKEGVGYGVFVVASAGGFGSGEIPSSMSGNFRTVVCLELANGYDYASYLRTTRIRLRPETGVAGRGIALVGERPLEFQTALCLPIEDETETGKLLHITAHAMSEAWNGEEAKIIPSIPVEPNWDDFYALGTVRSMLDKTELLPLGWDAKEAVPYGIDLVTTHTFLISGAKRKGKTNALRVLAASAHAKGGRVVFVDFEGTSKRFCLQLGIEHIGSEQEFCTFLAAIIPSIGERNKAKNTLRQEGQDEKAIYESMKSFERIFVFIDDLPSFVERAYSPEIQPEKTYDDYLTTVWEKCSLHNIFWFATVDKSQLGGASSRNLYKQFVRDQKGIHFGGQIRSTSVAAMSFDNHDRRLLDAPREVGRAMVAQAMESSVLEVVVPLMGSGIG